jgi:hypothetical protein
MIESSERLWMMRPSCSVMEQKVQPPKQPRMMFTLKRIISQAGILVGPSCRRTLGCGAAGVGQVEHQVHLGGGQRDGGRVDPHVARARAFAVALHQRAGVAGVGLEVQHAVGVGVEHRVAFHLLVGWAGGSRSSRAGAP